MRSRERRERTTEALRTCLEHAPQAQQYYSDSFPAYAFFLMVLSMKGDLTNSRILPGSGQGCLMPLFEMIGSQISMLHKKNAIASEEHSTLRLLLQPQAIGKESLPAILLSPH